MTKDPKNDRWTCPNDRNLQLRSKLNAGWSIHTGKKTLKKDPQLTESELIEIQKVLQRSEMLERNERDRVMKLVDRLENMKRNATQSTSCASSPNRCALCGDYFCLIRTAPTQCGSCQKILCNKCCIDTECTIDNDTSSNPSQSRRNSSSSISMTTSFINSTNINTNNNANSKVVVYLCRICSEQREFLKKSGAWFIKKYPNYLSNGEKYNSTSNISQLEKSPSQFNKSSLISPYLPKRNISTSSSNSSMFKFWNVKENVNNNSDNVSDFSNENDRAELDLNSNYDSNSITTRTASNENINPKTPTSPNKKQENFMFNSNINNSTANTTNSNETNSPTALSFFKIANSSENNSPTSKNNTNNNYNNTSIINNSNSNTTHINSSRTKSIFNNVNNTDTNHSVSDKKTQNFSFMSKNSNSNMNTTNSILNSFSLNGNKDKEIKDNKTQKIKETDLSDEETNSPNMSSYTYYSNMLTNLIPNQSTTTSSSAKTTTTNNIDLTKVKANEQLKSINSKNSYDDSAISNLNNIKNNNNIDNLKMNSNNKTSVNSLNQINNLKTKNSGSINSITNGIVNNTLSASASNLDSNYSDSSSPRTSLKSETSRTIRKNKVSEWCSTQLSMDDDVNESGTQKKANKALVKSKHFSNSSNTSSSYTSNSISTTNLNYNSKPKLSSQTVNNLAKKIINQNSSIVPIGSIAASSSSAVSSASSLATSLAKLNFK